MAKTLQKAPPKVPAEMKVDAKHTPLPPLRQGLEFIEGWPDHRGAPTWMFYDALRSQYFRVDDRVVKILTVWPHSTVETIGANAAPLLGRPVTVEDIEGVLAFLFTNQLTTQAPENGFQYFVTKDKAAQASFSQRLLHNYLFFKIPLFDPSPLLARSWPLVQAFYSKRFVVLFALLALLVVYLISRQWGEFVSQFIQFLSWKGVLYFTTSLVVVKTLHELSHALMAWKYRVPVNTIGVAFLLLMPILYTDTSNAWRLSSRQQRLMIDAAGIFAELALAVIAGLFWVFLPDGVLRAVAFSLATTSLLMGLAINLNPFMRFDGYYILSDMLGFENLQSRGFALAKWQMREAFFNLKAPRPERMTPKLETFIIAHAWGTWVYRLFLFIGIALLVYTFFIKPVAIALFVVEIIVFIGRPIYKELKKWWGLRDDIRQTLRGKTSALLFALVFITLCLPLSNTITVPVVIGSATEQTIFPPHAARLEKLFVQEGQEVEQGEKLAQFSSRSLDLQIKLTEGRMALLESRIGQAYADGEENNQLRILQSELRHQRETLRFEKKQRADLTITAPFSGTVKDVGLGVHEGRSFGTSDALFILHKTDKAVAYGLAAESEIGRLSQHQTATIIPDDSLLPKLSATVQRIASTPSKTLRDKELADSAGGNIPAQEGEQGRLSIVGNYYTIALDIAPSTIALTHRKNRGVALIEGESRSLMGRFLRHAAGVLIRESGF